jgi:hypothetical protein
MAYIRVNWPRSQKYNKLTDEEVEQYEAEDIMIYGPDASWIIDEDYIDEIDEICESR